MHSQDTCHFLWSLYVKSKNLLHYNGVKKPKIFFSTSFYTWFVWIIKKKNPQFNYQNSDIPALEAEIYNQKFILFFFSNKILFRILLYKKPARIWTLRLDPYETTSMKYLPFSHLILKEKKINCWIVSTQSFEKTCTLLGTSFYVLGFDLDYQ